MKTQSSESGDSLLIERQFRRQRMTDLITVATFIAIIFSYYFLPVLIEGLVFVGLLNVLIGTVKRKAII